MSATADKALLRKPLAGQIRCLRQKKGLSQEALAFRAGLHRTYISLIERSQRSLTIDSLERIALALDVKPSELLARSEASAPSLR